MVETKTSKTFPKPQSSPVIRNPKNNGHSHLLQMLNLGDFYCLSFQLFKLEAEPWETSPSNESRIAMLPSDCC